MTHLQTLCALTLIAAAVPGAPRDSPPGVVAPISERLSWNARERTAAGLAALGEGDAEAATRALDTALRLRPEDALVRFNAGTARIENESAEAAAMLREAAKVASPDLAPEAWYNAGNAHLAAGQPDAASEAFIETLRRRPDHAAAKFNLELARRQEERQQQERGGNEDERRAARPAGEPDERESTSRDSGEQGEDPQGQPEQETPGQQGNHAGQPSGDADPSSPLPQFRDLPDMTAEQAAAILQAVDNLERRQRRQRALEAATGRVTTEVDW